MFETFHTQSGGGITLTNLFKGWDPSRLANAVEAGSFNKINSYEQCANYYLLGSDELKISFPFSALYKYGKSGKVQLSNKISTPNQPGVQKQGLVKNIKAGLQKVTRQLNLLEMVFSITPSAGLLKWIDEFKPDYIYIQPSSLAGTRFFRQLHKITGIPLVVHIMDDWQHAFDKNSFLASYWEKKVDQEFRQLLNDTSVFLSISRGMSIEYFKRYGKRFTHFHNVIETREWLPFIKSDFSISKTIKILYAGRIGMGTYHSFFDIINAITSLNAEGHNIQIDIQSPAIQDQFLNKLKQFNCVTINPFIDYSELPKLFSSYDLLLLPIDFEETGRAFLKFSMPTKVAEFMISGTPILLYCPADIGLYEDATTNKWAYVVAEPSLDAIKNGLLHLVHNEALRRELSATAINYAVNNFDGPIVRAKFKDQFQ